MNKLLINKVLNKTMEHKFRQISISYNVKYNMVNMLKCILHLRYIPLLLGNTFIEMCSMTFETCKYFNVNNWEKNQFPLSINFVNINSVLTCFIFF